MSLLKTTIFFTAVISYFFISCSDTNHGEWRIADLSKDTVLTADINAKSINSIKLKIQGYSDDTIRVQGIKIPGGEINEEFNTDWYTPNLAIRFESYRAKKGNLTIQYFGPPNHSY
jgi:hypothetical protein